MDDETLKLAQEVIRKCAKGGRDADNLSPLDEMLAAEVIALYADLATERERVRVARSAIENAPHDLFCDRTRHLQEGDREKCIQGCWKSRALAQLSQPATQPVQEREWRAVWEIIGPLGMHYLMPTNLTLENTRESMEAFIQANAGRLPNASVKFSDDGGKTWTDAEAPKEKV